MKKLSKIKLNHLNDDELKNREMNNLRGGRICGCGCNYADSGGSTTMYNSPGGSKACYTEGKKGITSTLAVEGWA